MTDSTLQWEQVDNTLAEIDEADVEVFDPTPSKAPSTWRKFREWLGK